MSSAFNRRSWAVTVLVVGLFGAACTTPDESSPDAAGTGEDTTTTPVAPESAGDTTVRDGEGSTTSWDPDAVDDHGAGGLAAPAPMMLIQFGQSWADANWETMAAVADSAVVDAATDSHVPGAPAPITGENVESIIAGCEAEAEVTGDDEATWTCPLRYGDEREPAAFTMTIGQTKDGLRVTGLTAVGS